MRALAALLVVLALAGPEAEMLLDLDLLSESDPRIQREDPVARNVRLLELLERLNPAAVRRGGDSRPAPKEAC